MNNLTNNNIRIKLYVIMGIMIICFSVILFFLVKVMVVDKEKYENLLEVKTGKIYKGKEAPRGNIYDVNGVLLVGNKSVPIIKYRKSNLSSEEEVKLAYLISENVELDYESVSEEDIINFIYDKDYEKLLDSISDNVKEKYEKRVISESEFVGVIKRKINLSEVSVEDKRASYVYALMNKGYLYEDKLIKNSEVSEEEISFINGLDNFYISYRYVRYYPYREVLRSVFGNVGAIREEELESYLEKGYFRNDIVGVSYLESEYESYLKGTHEAYVINSEGEREIINEAIPGNDLYLTIDINLQLEVEEIIKTNMLKAKNEANTELYNKVYAIVGNAYDGSIYAFVGKELLYNGKYSFVDRSLGIVTDAITPGSSVKGASHIVGYEVGAIDYGYTVRDACIKIRNVDEKCSWKSLGMIDDVEALKYSSNYYQFLIAIKIGKGKYSYNAPLNLDANGFNIYRSYFNDFGLGVLTGIDLPYESVGFKGNDEYAISLLDFPIGQYDNYTPIQMFQYISTIYNDGTRVAPHLGGVIKNGEEVVSAVKRNVVGGVNAKSEHFERVKFGLSMVMESGGTGSGYIDLSYKPFGKTGTAQSFIDTNMDGKIDTETVSTSFVGVAEGITFVVLSPNVSSRRDSYTSSVNKRISREITDLYLGSYR